MAFTGHVLRGSIMAFTGHVLRGSSSEDVIQRLEGKLEATTSQERPRRMWQDDIKQWTQLNTYEDIKKTGSMSVESLHGGMSTF